jgi:hypothetical protein
MWLAEWVQALGLRPGWTSGKRCRVGLGNRRLHHRWSESVRFWWLPVQGNGLWHDDAQAKVLAAFGERQARFSIVRLPQADLPESVRETALQDAPAADFAPAIKFLRNRTWIDLRWPDGEDMEPFEECLRQLLGRTSHEFGVSERIQDALARKLEDERRRRQWADAHRDSATLIRLVPELKPEVFGSDGPESLRLQIAEAIGMPSAFVTVFNKQTSPPRVTLRFALPEDAERLFAMVEIDDPFLSEVLDRWAVDRTRFRNDNQDAVARLKEQLVAKSQNASSPGTKCRSPHAQQLAVGTPACLSDPECRLKNFRCFSELALDLDRPSTLGGYWTCLAGINGSGKSSILQAICIGLLSQSTVHELGGGLLERLRRLEDGRRQDLEVTIRCRDRDGQRVRRVDHHPTGRSPIGPAGAGESGIRK